MNELRIALAIITALFITACGLQGDLYIPSETPSAATDGSQNRDGETAEDEKTNQPSASAP